MGSSSVGDNAYLACGWPWAPYSSTEKEQKMILRCDRIQEDGQGLPASPALEFMQQEPMEEQEEETFMEVS